MEHGCFVIQLFTLGHLPGGQGMCEALSGGERVGRTDTRTAQIRKSLRGVDRDKYIHLPFIVHDFFAGIRA